MNGAVVVTGAGRGIGRAVAVAFAERGYDVALLGRSIEELEVVAGDVAQRGRRALALRCDVTVTNDVEHARKRVLAELGTPKVVVNNAGIVKRSLVHETTDADWDEVIGVNLRGPFLVTRAFLKFMLPRGEGRIVMISSISATMGTARQSSYCASKWGLDGFTKSLAEELRGTGLAAIGIRPGSVDTDMLKGSGFEPQMTADEVAKLVTFAAEGAPSAMNGSILDMFGR